MATGERSPIEGIVDIDSLSVWVQEYRADSLLDPRVIRRSVPLPVREEDELIGQQSLAIRDFPWENLPVSLQEVLKIQYESAKREGSGKTISGQVGEDSLDLILESPDVVRGYDTFAETHSAHGVILDFTDSLRPPFLPSSRGFWQINRSPAILRAKIRQMREKFLRGELDSGELAELMGRGVRSPEPWDFTIPATVDQLRDVANYLLIAKSYREIAIFEVNS